jgi:hypothetical protein
MTCEPYASARRVFWVVDNGSLAPRLDRGGRLADAFPNAAMIHLPVHPATTPPLDRSTGRFNRDDLNRLLTRIAT